jgi:hypothetical protein
LQIEINLSKTGQHSKYQQIGQKGFSQNQYQVSCDITPAFLRIAEALDFVLRPELKTNWRIMEPICGGLLVAM